MSPLLPIFLAQVAPTASPEVQGEFFFAQPAWLWALPLLIPLLLLWRKQGSKAWVAHPSIALIQERLKATHTLTGRWGKVLLCLALASLIVCLAQAQWRKELSEEKVSGIDIMIACDLSSSMGARDMLFTGQDARGRTVRSEIDRLSAAKHVISQFISKRPNDRMGMIAFAGKAKLSCPLTLDHALLLHMLDQFYLIDPYSGRPGYVSVDGTAIGSAIASAATRLEERESTKSKIIILVTDGQSNAGSIAPLDAARQAAKLGIRVFTIGIGQKKRLSARVSDDGVDEETLEEIARLTHGRYFRASSGQALMQAFEGIDQLEKTEAKRRTIIKDTPLYQYPLALALLCLSLGFALHFIRPQAAP